MTVGLTSRSGSLLPSLVVLGQALSRPRLEISYKPLNCSIGTGFHSSIKWGRRSDLNRQPTVYKTVAQPLCYCGVYLCVAKQRIGSIFSSQIKSRGSVDSSSSSSSGSVSIYRASSFRTLCTVSFLILTFLPSYYVLQSHHRVPFWYT